MALHRGHRRLRPLQWARRSNGGILNDIGPPRRARPLMGHANHDDPTFIRSSGPCDRRVHRNNHTVHLGQFFHPTRTQHMRRPKRALHVLQQLTIQLLAPQPGPLIAALDLGQETVCQIGPVGMGRGMGLNRAFPRQQIFQNINVARCRGHHTLRVVAQTQTKLQHIPSILRLFPLCQLINPSRIKLRPTKRLWLTGRKTLRLGTIRPHQLTLRGLPFRLTVRRTAGKNATVPENHNIPRLVIGFPNQRDTFGPAALKRPGPFYH